MDMNIIYLMIGGFIFLFLISYILYKSMESMESMNFTEEEKESFRNEINKYLLK